MAKKTAKKAAPKQAKKPARRPIKRTPLKAKPAKATKRPKAKAKAVKPLQKKKPAAVKARKAMPMSKPVRKVLARKAPPRAAAPKASVKQTAKPAPVRKVAAAAAPTKRAAVPPPATLQRERRRLPEAEEETFSEVSEDSRLMNSARAGHDELRSEMKKHTEASPALTAGDVDAKWQDAYALGDEAPGGDNMTPDQDRVDDIGKALGIEYADDEELLGGDELVERDEHRWELDPASKDEDEDL